MSFIIKEGFTNNKGDKIDSIRNIHYDENLSNFNFGELVDETEYKNNIFLSSSFNLTNGVYIYKSNYDHKVALRVYRDTLGCCKDYKYRYHDDDKLVSELQKLQDKIKLTDFPTGIVTIGNYVIGQEIPFYENYKTLAQVVSVVDEKTIFLYYSYIINILEELYDNGIIYVDVRARNFMINNINNLVKLIDFESQYINFTNSSSRYRDMMENLRTMVNEINSLKGINFLLPSDINLDDVKSIILEEKVKRLKV